MFSPNSAPRDPTQRVPSASGSARPTPSPVPVAARTGMRTPGTPSRVVLGTPNRPAGAQLVHLDSSGGEFKKRPHRGGHHASFEEDSDEEILDETESHIPALRKADSTDGTNSGRSGTEIGITQPSSDDVLPATSLGVGLEAPPLGAKANGEEDAHNTMYTEFADSTSAAPTPATPTTPINQLRTTQPPHLARQGNALTATRESSAASSQSRRTSSEKPRPTNMSARDVEQPASPEGHDEDGSASGALGKDWNSDKRGGKQAKRNGGRQSVMVTSPTTGTSCPPSSEQPPAADPRTVAGSNATGTPGTPPRVTLGKKELIGAGSFGTVYRALDLSTNRTLAVKEIRLMHAENPAKAKKELEGLEREIRVMAKLSHPNIVKYLGYTRGDDGTFNIHMEYVSCGTVSSLLKTFGPLQPIQAALFTKQILEGLGYLHSRRIAHRDLKGDNLFVDVDGTLKLGDFGTAKELQTIRVSNSIAGTPYFMAPEVVKNGGHGIEADIWSLGCCVIQMLTGAPPFRKFDNQVTVMFQVSKGDIASQVPETIPDDARAFILACCRKEPKDRPHVDELRSHPWLMAAPPVATRAPPPPPPPEQLPVATTRPSAAPSLPTQLPVGGTANPRSNGTIKPGPTSANGSRRPASKSTPRGTPSKPGVPSTTTSGAGRRVTPPATPQDTTLNRKASGRGVAAARMARKDSQRQPV